MVGLEKETQQCRKETFAAYGKTSKNQKSKKTEVKTKKQSKEAPRFFISGRARHSKTEKLILEISDKNSYHTTDYQDKKLVYPYLNMYTHHHGNP